MPIEIIGGFAAGVVGLAAAQALIRWRRKRRLRRLGVLPELRDLPQEVRHLVYAVEGMRSKWGDGDDAVRDALWVRVMRVMKDLEAVWARHDGKSLRWRSH